jgi:hypothetical protein
MENIFNVIKIEYIYISVILVLILLFILYIINIVKLSKIGKEYKNFMKKIGNGDNIQESLEKYIDELELIKEENNKLKDYCKKLDGKVVRCTQRIGLVRYSAFKDTGSDLSFALALLDEENSGVVLNGIYSMEMSNIFSKPVEKGTSTYTLSEEEKQAINKAMMGL